MYMTDCMNYLASYFFIDSEYKTRAFKEFREMLKYFAGAQIRNVAVSH